MNDEKWVNHLRMSYDIVAEIHNIRVWASGCKCHEEERLRGSKVSCVNQGLRLPEIVPKLEGFFDYCRACARGPVDSHCAKDLPFELEVDRSRMWSVLLAMVKRHTHFYWDDPYSLARVETVAQLDLARKIWVAIAPEERHRVSSYIFDVSGTSCIIIIMQSV